MRKLQLLFILFLVASFSLFGCGGGGGGSSDPDDTSKQDGGAQDGGEDTDDTGKSTAKLSSLTGQVMDQDFMPIAGVKITATYNYEGKTGDTITTISQESGAFSFTEFSEGRYVIKFDPSEQGNIQGTEFPVMLQYKQELVITPLVLPRLNSSELIEDTSSFNHVQDEEGGNASVFMEPDSVSPVEGVRGITVGIEEIPADFLPNPLGFENQALESDDDSGGYVGFTVNWEGIKKINKPIQVLFPGHNPKEGTTEAAKKETVMLEGFNKNTGRWKSVLEGRIKEMDIQGKTQMLLGENSAPNTPFHSDQPAAAKAFYTVFDFSQKYDYKFYRFKSFSAASPQMLTVAPTNYFPVVTDDGKPKYANIKANLSFGDCSDKTKQRTIADLDAYYYYIYFYVYLGADKEGKRYVRERKYVRLGKNGEIKVSLPVSLRNHKTLYKRWTTVLDNSFVYMPRIIYARGSQRYFLILPQEKEQKGRLGYYIKLSLADFLKIGGKTLADLKPDAKLVFDKFCMNSIVMKMGNIRIMSNTYCPREGCISPVYMSEFNKISANFQFQGEKFPDNFKEKNISLASWYRSFYFPFFEGNANLTFKIDDIFKEHLQMEKCFYSKNYYYNYFNRTNIPKDAVKDCMGEKFSFKLLYNNNFYVKFKIKKDTDKDGVADIVENKIKTNPNEKDTDGDGLDDNEELFYTYVPGSRFIGSSPLLQDSDNDGLDDKAEKERKLNALRMDTDMDSLYDGEEVNKFKTDPLKMDTDGDRIMDGIEVTFNGDPLNKDKKPQGTVRFVPFYNFPRLAGANMDAAFCDINQDKYPDIVVPHLANLNVGWFNSMQISNGGGGYLDTKLFFTKQRDASTSAVCADVNGDGNVDIIFGNTKKLNKEGAQNRIYLAKGKYDPKKRLEENFTDATTTNLAQKKDTTLDMEFMDLNNDNKPDLLILANGHQGQGGAKNRVYKNEGGKFVKDVTDIWFEPAQNKGETRVVKVGDLNKDNKPDVVFGQDKGIIKVWLNKGNKFELATVEDMHPIPGEYLSLQIVDHNNDGYNDILYTCKKRDSSRTSLISGNTDPAVGLLVTNITNGNTTFTHMPLNDLHVPDEVLKKVKIPSDKAEFVASVMVDVDKDGNKDLITASFFDYNYFFRNMSASGFRFRPGILPWDWDNTSNIHVQDFNGDGVMDLFMNSYNAWFRDYLMYRGQRHYAKSFLTGIAPESFFINQGSYIPYYFNIYGRGFTKGTKVYLKKDDQVVFKDENPKYISSNGRYMRIQWYNNSGFRVSGRRINQNQSELLTKISGFYDLEVVIPEVQSDGKVKEQTYIQRNRFYIYGNDCHRINYRVAFCPVD